MGTDDDRLWAGDRVIEMFHRISQNASGTTVEPVHDTPMMEENPIEKVEEKVEEEEEVHEVPTKLVSETCEVIIRATILSIDFEGKAMERAFVPHHAKTAPRRVVLCMETLSKQKC